MTKYEIAVRLLAEYCDCPSKDGVPTEIPEEWCEKHCDYKGDAAEETVKCWEKVISDRYEAQGDVLKYSELPNSSDLISRQAAIEVLESEPCRDAVSRDFMRELGATCIAKRGEDGELVPILNIDSLPSVNPKPVECEDAVSRQAVLDAINNPLNVRLDVIIKNLPPVTPKNLLDTNVGKIECEDVISRQAVIEALDKRFDSIPMEQTTEILLLRKDLRDIPSVQPKQRWIPCSERLPEEERYVLITKESFKINGYEQEVIKAKRSADPRSGKIEWWSPEFGTLKNKAVLAWMPMPEPYKEEKK